MNAGVMGLGVNATRLAAIADNIANTKTYGYKKADADFTSMVIASGGSAKYTAGGVGVNVQRLIDEVGSLVGTTNATDLAVRGSGFIPVTTATAVALGDGDYPLRLMTTASFRPDESGYLTTQTDLVLMGWPADADGTIPEFPRDTKTGLEPVKINMSALDGEPTTEVTLGINLPAASTEETAPDSESISVEYYDNLGDPETLDFTFTPTASTDGLKTNQWTMTVVDSATLPAGTVIGEYILDFNDTTSGGGSLGAVTTVSGGAYDSTTGAVTVTAARGDISVNIGMLDTSDGLTQLSASFAPTAISKNGAAVGTMTSVEVDSSGYVYALYDTGVTRIVYQIPLANMPNPNGMDALEKQTYQVTNDSGPFYLWDAGDGSTGAITGYAREESLTDVGEELTNLIQTQRAYSSNAKVIQTVDEMLQETANIKR